MDAFVSFLWPYRALFTHVLLQPSPIVSPTDRQDFRQPSVSIWTCITVYFLSLIMKTFNIPF